MRPVPAILALLVLAPAGRRGAQGGDPPHLARDPAHQGRDFYGAATATATRSPRTTCARSPTPTSRSTASARATSGPTARYESRGNGTTPNNLNSDFFFQRIKDDRVVEKLLEQPPPAGPLPEVREGARGYVAGYNAYLAEVGVDGIPDARCRGKAWVRPITELDAFRRFYQLALLASSGVAIDGIAQAQPPTPAAARRAGAVRPAAADRRATSARWRTGCRSATSARTPSRSARRRPTTARACCSATRTSPGTGPSASTRRSSRSPARPTSPAPRCSACR